MGSSPEPTQCVGQCRVVGVSPPAGLGICGDGVINAARGSPATTETRGARRGAAGTLAWNAWVRHAWPDRISRGGGGGDGASPSAVSGGVLAHTRVSWWSAGRGRSSMYRSRAAELRLSQLDPKMMRSRSKREGTPERTLAGNASHSVYLRCRTRVRETLCDNLSVGERSGYTATDPHLSNVSVPTPLERLRLTGSTGGPGRSPPGRIRPRRHRPFSIPSFASLRV